MQIDPDAVFSIVIDAPQLKHPHISKLDPSPPKYESDGTWFGEPHNGATFPRIKTVYCPVCQLPGDTIMPGPGTHRAVRVLSYREYREEPGRVYSRDFRIKVRIEAACLCGAEFLLDRVAR